MDSKAAQFASVAIGVLIAAFLSLHLLSDFRDSTFEKGRIAGIADAKAYIRFQICLRQQFTDAGAIRTASKVERETAVSSCIELGDWPYAWRTELDGTEGGWRETPDAAQALDESFRMWLWNGGKVQPVRSQLRLD